MKKIITGKVKLMMGLVLGLVIFNSLVLFAQKTDQQSNVQLQSSFENPPMENRPNLNTHGYPLDYKKQDSILDQYLLNGYGGLATNVNWTDDYLKNDMQMDYFFRFVKSARAKGMNVWLYDENWYPSGMAGGYILEEHPEWEAEGLLFKDTLVHGPDKTELNLLPGNLLAIKAVPVIDGSDQLEDAIDISGFTSDGKLSWEVPSGTWRLAQFSTNILREGFQAGNERGGKERYYPSLLMPEVTKRFIELTHKKYAEALNDPLGSLFYATFTDEPSSMGHSFTNVGYGVYPWKKNLSEELESRFGWKPEDELLTILLDEGSEGKKMRYQYFSLVSEFMSQHHFRAIKEFCNEQGIKASGHLLLEESLLIHVLLYGDIMACFREMDIPGIDVLTGMPDFTRRYLYSSRLAASTAELNGTTEVMSEICPVADPRFHNGKEAPTTDVKGTVNRQLAGGVTRFNNYLKLQHATQEEKMEFNTYVARVSLMMNKGVRASRIAVLYPVESMWPKFRPAPAWNKGWDDMSGGNPEARKVSELFDKVSDHLYEDHREFSYLDNKGLSEAEVRDGKLIHGDLEWEVLILPRVETISENAMMVIEEFLGSGGKVVALEALPENSTVNFPSAKIMKLSEKLFKDKVNSPNALYLEKFSEGAFQDILAPWVERDYKIEKSDQPVLCSLKKSGNERMLFMINDSNEPAEIVISFETDNPVEKHDPNTGNVEKISNPSRIKLAGYDGVLFSYKQ